MGAWGAGCRSRGLLPTDPLRRRGTGPVGGGPGAWLVREGGRFPGWETELGLEAALVVEQEDAC